MCFKGGTTTPLTSAPSARGLGILAFPDALARLVLKHAATARKTAPLQKLKRSFGLRSVRGIVVAPWRWRRVFRSATDREGPCLGPRARPPTPPTCRTGPQDSPPPSLDPSGLIQTLTTRPWRRRRPSASPGVWCLKVLHAVDAPPLTPPYNAPKLLADTSLDRRHIAGIAARSPAEHANSNPGCACQALCAAAPRATAPQSHAPSLAAAPSRAMHAPHCLQLMAAEG
jgi:hypothetical protein